MNGSDEPVNGVPRRLDFRTHAVAGVQNDSDTDRCVLIPIEVSQRLALAIFLHQKVALLQAAHVAAGGVDHRGINVHEPDIDTQAVRDAGGVVPLKGKQRRAGEASHDATQ